MKPSAGVVLFLGAGVSLPHPAGGPMFAEVRNACADLAGVTISDDELKSRRKLLLDSVIPEVFLKLFADAGYRLEEPLVRAVAGTPGTGPNAVHRLAARILAAGGAVWTTNWDCWIEQAYADHTGTEVDVSGPGLTPIPADPRTAYGKLHGTAAIPRSLLFSTPQVMRPLPDGWHRAVVASCLGRQLFVVGYAGADVDLYPTLRAAISAATATYWLEMTEPLEDEEKWRFALSPTRVDPASLPLSDAHLVWCGTGASAFTPSRAILDIFEDPADVSVTPTWQERYDAVRAQLASADMTGTSWDRRRLLSALVMERLSHRRRAALLYLILGVAGRGASRRKAHKSIGNLVLMRARRARRLLVTVYRLVGRNPVRRDVAAVQTGSVDHDPDLAARVAAGTVPDLDVDQALNLASTGRWTDHLPTAEMIARAQLPRLLASDLGTLERDQPNRVARAAFEVAQSLIWQGRFIEADDWLRSYLLRVAGATFLAWELALRAVVRFAYSEHAAATELLVRATAVLEAEGFHNFGLSLWTSLSACHRIQRHYDRAEQQLRQAERWPQMGPGSAAICLAERAELQLATGHAEAARASWEKLTGSKLPLWRGLGHLRLAEQGQDSALHTAQALAAFDRIKCRWGTIRTTALAGGLAEREVRRLAAGLGPPDTFMPRAVWLL